MAAGPARSLPGSPPLPSRFSSPPHPRCPIPALCPPGAGAARAGGTLHSQAWRRRAAPRPKRGGTGNGRCYIRCGVPRTGGSGCDLKSVPECGPTGFVEKISCAASKRDEYKSCRSAVLESRLFWRFVGSMMAVAAVCSVLVVWRQRALDRRALEKVRKQIESI
uniref:Jumping translocation breakpoint n=1 Tax=Coturnix japonica TaxID=93934 RepID=A0A8C2TU36_COTJA